MGRFGFKQRRHRRSGAAHDTGLSFFELLIQALLQGIGDGSIRVIRVGARQGVQAVCMVVKEARPLNLAWGR